MRIQVVCVLLVSLCATVLSQPADVYPRYQKFIDQHINRQMRIDRCDAVINGKRISKTNSNECKETNTFIRANLNTVRSVCERGGVPAGNGLTRSLNPFDIVVCTLKNHGGTVPHCRYRGQSRTRYINFACDRGYPVHFDGDIVHLEN